MIEPYRKELEEPFPMPVTYGARGAGARRVQEWLGLAGFSVVVDGDFGAATQTALRDFQIQRRAFERTPGAVDSATWRDLVSPLSSASTAGGDHSDFGRAVVVMAQAHLRFRAREIGGDNKGPWVRHYCRGFEVAWCQGFVSTIWQQAAAALSIEPPLGLELDGVWCLYVPRMVTEAKNRGLFRDGRTLAGPAPAPGSMFFLRGGSAGYSHVGIVVECRGETMVTIEGNTNDDGSANGYEVARRTRQVAGSDFAVLP